MDTKITTSDVICEKRNQSFCLRLALAETLSHLGLLVYSFITRSGTLLTSAAVMLFYFTLFCNFQMPKGTCGTFVVEELTYIHFSRDLWFFMYMYKALHHKQWKRWGYEFLCKKTEKSPCLKILVILGKYFFRRLQYFCIQLLKNKYAKWLDYMSGSVYQVIKCHMSFNIISMAAKSNRLLFYGI